MFRITEDPSSGSLVQCLAKNYKNDYIVSVDMDPLCTHIGSEYAAITPTLSTDIHIGVFEDSGDYRLPFKRSGGTCSGTKHHTPQERNHISSFRVSHIEFEQGQVQEFKNCAETHATCRSRVLTALYRMNTILRYLKIVFYS